MKNNKYRKRRTGMTGKLKYWLRRILLVIPGKFNGITRRGVFTVDWLSTYWRRESFVYADGDFVRNSSLELVAREITGNNIIGAVAELGVFRGDYAKLINRAFPDRKLYLFDTFEGFDPRDVDLDREKGFSGDVDDFSSTSIKRVLKKMKHPDNCVIMKGYFPDTAIGLDERFSFVNIDCDLYTPVRMGLDYFWKRLADGGYMFIHDYQDPVYSGARTAIKEFCIANSVAYFPMTDTCGSAVIAKPMPIKQT